jgi:predicted DsbA family dithiol-disulfide isomerase
MLDRVTTMAAAEGLDFRFDVNRGGNSFDAHRLLHLAKARGRQDDLKERFDRGTFTEGLAVSDHDELTKLAVEIGLDEAEVREVLGSDRYAADVRADQERARALGISGVPCFVIDGTYGVSGAQPAEAFAQIVRQVWAERAENAPVGA